jgi:phosphoribosylformylglycinamidine synthase subunit PurQ / glutaminase
MSKARVAVLYSPGTNCHEETVAAFELAGGAAEVVLLRDLLDERLHLDDYQAAIVPGGFSYGDHLGAGRIFATLLVAGLYEELARFLDKAKPILGICNGFQVLTEAGLLPGRAPGKRSMALIENQSAHFEDRKVRLRVTGEASFWTKGLEGQTLQLPSAHGEGRPLFCEAAERTKPRVLFRYCGERGETASSYPDNPNGAPEAIAGVCDAAGLVMGLMPHPERASFPTNYSQDGLKIFQNLVAFLQ